MAAVAVRAAAAHDVQLAVGGLARRSSRPGTGDILALLVAGAKDEVIARQLGIGVRTLRRRMQHLMTALDAETRFQAGIQASRRGWV